MLSPRVLRLSRSPRPAFEWHAGELETALVLARRPDLARRRLIRRLPPAWVDFGAALRHGARTFEEIAPGGLGYFGWPAAARAVTAKRALRAAGRADGSRDLARVRQAAGGRGRRARRR